MAAAAPAASRKRAAPDGPCPVASGVKKRPRYNFSSIYDYDNLGVLGEGASGVVMSGRHRRTGDEVAIKWIRDTRVGGDISAVVREGGCLAKCRGAPSVVQIRDVAINNTGDLFIITELLHGGTLRDRLNIRGRFAEPQARAAMRQLLTGVAWMHGAGMMLHRDLKPENVLIGPGGALKICDFGMATPARLPYPGDPARVGTMWYRAPEQVMGSLFYGAPVDIWALGCIMFELLTGQLLFAQVETEDDLLKEMFDLRHRMELDGVAAFRGLPLDLSQDAGDLLCGLLCYDEDKRLTAAEGLKHKWFAEEAAED